MCADRFHVFKVDNEWRGEAPTYEVRKNAGGTSDDWYEGECVGVFETELEARAHLLFVLLPEGGKGSDSPQG